MGNQKTKPTENEQKHEAFSSFLMLKLYFPLKTLMTNSSLFFDSQFLLKFVPFTLNYYSSTGHGLGKLCDMCEELKLKAHQIQRLNLPEKSASLGVSLSFRKNASHEDS